MSSRRPRIAEPPAAAKAWEEKTREDLAWVVDENGRWALVPEDPRDVFNDPFSDAGERARPRGA